MKVTAGGRKKSVRRVHASQVFSHAQLRVNFMGKVKLPVMAPAAINRISPNAALCMSIVWRGNPEAMGGGDWRREHHKDSRHTAALQIFALE